MICHIAFESDYSCEYNKFIQNSFDINDHVFLITGRASWDPSKKYTYANSLYVQSLEEPQAVQIIESAKRVIIHGLFFKQVVEFFFHHRQFLKKTDWMVWGGDFYVYREAGTVANPSEYEQMRRTVISNMDRIIALPEEFRLIQDVYQTRASQIDALYPLILDYGYLDTIRNETQHNMLPVIQIGNSGTPTNCHLETFAVLERFKGERFEVFCPMSYGNEQYIEYVVKTGRDNFGAGFHPMTAFQPFQEYANFLNTVDVAIMNHDRQQAVGNILSLLYLGKKVYMRNGTASSDFFRRYGLMIHDAQEIGSQSFEEFLAFDRRHAGHNIETIRNNFSNGKCRDAWASVFAESNKVTVAPEKPDLIADLKQRYFPGSTFVGPYERNGNAFCVPEEQWLWARRHFIRGVVLDMSTPRYWHDYVHELPTVDRVLISEYNSPIVAKYEHQSPADIVGDFCSTPPPMPANSVDTIICLSILEHCADPFAMVRNLGMIAKPGGYILIDAPFAYIDGHLSPDYWRFGRDGLRLLAEKADLQIVEEGSFGDLGKFLIPEFGKDASANGNHRGIPLCTWIVCRKPVEAVLDLNTSNPSTDVIGSTTRLYAGDVPDRPEYNGWIGLSLSQENDRHIRHDITRPLPFPDNSVEAFQAEDVLEHIQYDRLVPILDEVHRVLRPGALFRLSVPDYRCDVLEGRSVKNDQGEIIFDPYGGGTQENPGHVWFPRYKTLKSLLEKSRFSSEGMITFLHFYDEGGLGVTRPIDYSKGHVQRTPDFDPRVRSPYRPMSLVVDLTKGPSAATAQNAHATAGTTPASTAKLVKMSFVMIVLNGMPFIEHALKAIYDEAHEIIIVEGAVEKCLFAANPDGSSMDGTVECIQSFPDPQRKIRLIQGRWPEKCEMQNAALDYVTGNYVWLVDSDEIYKRADIDRIRALLAEDPAITQVNFIPDNFWKGFDYLFVSPRFFEPANHYRRLFKFKPGSHFTTHRPPTMVWPGQDIPTEQMKLLDGAATRKMGIYPYHYSYVLDSQVRQKIELYRRYGWGDGWRVDLERWYREFFQQWTPENGRELERFYPIWTGDPHSSSVPFTGTHPEVMAELITACRGSELASLDGSGIKTPRVPDGPDAAATAGAAGGNIAKKFRIAGEGVVGSDLTQIQEGSGFEASLRELVLSIKPRMIIETGTYLGTGTTRIVATALRDGGLAGTTFYSIECNPTHHRQSYLNLDQAGLLPFVKPILGLSVPRNLLPSIERILDDTVRNVVEDGIFVDHQEQDRAALYNRETDFPDIPDDLIGACLEQSGGRPDLVLLDSGGHMGSVEFNYVIEQLQGECYLVLDDIRHVKHYQSFQQLRNDPRFTVVTSSDEKFGFCIARFSPEAGKGPEAEVEKRWILWVRPDSIGDNILAMAALPHLKARRPDAAIAVFCQEHVAELYEACPAVDRVITFNRQRALHDEAYRSAILGQLQALRADICLNSVYSRDLIVDFFATRSGAQERIALMGDLSNTTAQDREAYNQFYTSIVTSAGDHKPEMERHQDFLRGIGITGERLKPSLWVLPEDIAFGDRFFKEQGFEPEKTIALFAGAQYGVRLYGGYGAALAAFCRENGFSVVALGAAGDHGINQHNLDAIGVKTANLNGATTLRQGAAILSRCRLAVGAETGLAHMACAVGTPNVILLGGGHFGRFMPYSPLTSVVCLPLECYGCNWQCRYERVHCVRDISPAVIAEALRHSLAGSAGRIRYFVQGGSLWKPEAGGPVREIPARFMSVGGELITVENTEQHYGN